MEKGTPPTRSDPMVLERPDLFEVGYRLDQEVTSRAACGRTAAGYGESVTPLGKGLPDE